MMMMMMISVAQCHNFPIYKNIDRELEGEDDDDGCTIHHHCFQ